MIPTRLDLPDAFHQPIPCPVRFRLRLSPQATTQAWCAARRAKKQPAHGAPPR
ncbi:hypothetical protein [Kingella denitrificans]